MVTTTIHGRGVRGPHLPATSRGAVGRCSNPWLRAKTIDQDERRGRPGLWRR